LCVTYCPTEAIRLNRINKRVSIDPDKCIDCGICAAVCPTEVYKPTNSKDQELINKGRSILKVSHNLEIGCGEIREDIQTDRIVEVSCLGAIHQAHILGLVALGADALHFRHGSCVRCAAKYGKELISQTICEVKNILSPFPEIADLKLTSSDKSADFSTPAEVLDDLPADEQNIEKISRRAFLTSLIKKGQHTVAYSLNLVLMDDKRATKKRNKLEKYLPSKRKLMLAAINSFGHTGDMVIDTTNLTGITDLEILSDQCSVCPTCANFCPTGALSRTDTKDKKGKVIEATLYFNPGHCTKCGLCVVACFTNAMHYKDQLNIRSFISEHPRILQEKNL